MEIYLKMEPYVKIQHQSQLNLNELGFTQACGYNFSHNNSYNSQNVQKSIQQSTKHSFFVDKLIIKQQKSQQQTHLSIYNDMIEAYQQHKIDQANKLAQLYIKQMLSNNIEIQQQKLQFLQQIKQQMQDVLNYQKQILKQGWIHKQSAKNCQIFTKHFQQTVAVLVQAQIQVPIQNFIFVLNQFNLMKDFMPFMIKSLQVKQVSRNCKIGHIVNDFPLISKRQAFFQGLGYDRLNHNKTILLFSRSIHNRQDLQRKLGYNVQTNKDSIQLEYKFFLVEYSPINKNKGKIKIAMNVDMKLSLPKFIMDPVSQNFGKDFLKNVLQVAHNFKGSRWQKNSQQKPQFTNFIRKSIEKYFPNN